MTDRKKYRLSFAPRLPWWPTFKSSRMWVVEGWLVASKLGRRSNLIILCTSMGESVPSLPSCCWAIFRSLFFNFSDSVTDNPINQLSAVAIKSIVPGAVFRAAQLNGSQPFGLPNDLLNWTITVYVGAIALSFWASEIYQKSNDRPAICPCLQKQFTSWTQTRLLTPMWFLLSHGWK